MTRGELLGLHTQLSSEALALMEKKNADYGASNDPFRNFHMFGGLGILVRLSDKIARLRSFEERGKFEVTDEGLKDTCLDLLNYAILYYSYKTKDAASGE